ncbi:MAG: hypothetical protein IJF61_05925 [Clostridia bacterium]|nr:hypothetical protein [Clostridia bacterium]
MNWGRAKTILIVMFLVTDVFLLFVLMQTKFSASKIPEKTIRETVQFLGKKQIQVQPDQISKKRIKSENIFMVNFFKEPESAAKKILGEDVITVLQNPADYEYQFESPRGKLHLHDQGFSYVSSKEAVPYNIDSLPGAEAATSFITDALQGLGFDKATVSIVNLYEQDGFYHLTAVPVCGGVNIYGINMHIVADSEGIVTLEGHWFIAGEEAKGEEETLLDITTVLTELALKHTGEPMVISEIGTAYYASDDFLGSLEITAVPIYVIKDEAGGVHLFDARVGSAIE